MGVGDAFCVGYLPGLLDRLAPDRRLDRTNTLVRSHTPVTRPLGGMPREPGDSTAPRQ
ncbi:hypothetical protein RGQ21_03060 [Kitasatospora aureofaciens]|nr:hypothetical protein RGQ21_03060 [Kitasatospora aureofaciens]